MVVIASAALVPAVARAGLPIRIPAPRVLPSIKVRVRAVPGYETIVVRAREAGGYGEVGSDAANQLDDLRSDAVSAVDNGAKRIGLTARARELLRDCAAEGVQATAHDFGGVLAAATVDAPYDGSDAFTSAAAGCVGAGVPGASDDDRSRVAAYLLDLIDGYMQGAGEAARETATPGQRPAAHQLWMEATAQDISAGSGGSDTATGAERPTGSTSSDGGSFLPWMGAAALLLLAVLLLRRAVRR